MSLDGAVNAGVDAFGFVIAFALAAMHQNEKKNVRRGKKTMHKHKPAKYTKL